MIAKREPKRPYTGTEPKTVGVNFNVEPLWLERFEEFRQTYCKGLSKSEFYRQAIEEKMQRMSTNQKRIDFR